MKKLLVLYPIVLLASVPAIGQSYSDIEFGAIFSLDYKNSNSGHSPLVVNQGDGSFMLESILFLATQANENISFYAAFEAENSHVEVYGLTITYQLKNMPWINFEAGKFFAPFGNFLARLWASENPLIEWPVYYQYRTALSALELPENPNELLAVRGLGNRFHYGDMPRLGQPGEGIRIISQGVYPIGVHVFGELGGVKYNFGAANGALSNPADVNNSNGVQLLSRLMYNPLLGLELGVSFSTGVYLNKTSVRGQLQSSGKTTEDYRQFTTAFNLSYSTGHLEFYSELLLNGWQSPFISENLNASAFYVEGKYKLLSRFYLAGRFSMITFSDIDDQADIDGDTRLRESWDYDIMQTEIGVAYRINRIARLKFSKLFNKTLGVPTGDPKDNRLAFQLVAFF